MAGSLSKIPAGRTPLFRVVNNQEYPYELITYNEKKKILYIPVVEENGKLNRRMFIYQLKNELFEYTGIEKRLQGTLYVQPFGNLIGYPPLNLFEFSKKKILFI